MATTLIESIILTVCAGRIKQSTCLEDLFENLLALLRGQEDIAEILLPLLQLHLLLFKLVHSMFITSRP